MASDPNEADALLDLSNIVRDDRLGGRGPADLIRVERVGEALTSLYGAERALMLAVADDSLLTRKDLFLLPQQRRTLRGWAESGLILTAGKADVPLLRIAEATGLPIITRDRFSGHRREFTWLNGSDDAILEPRTDRYGEVSLHHVTLHTKDEWQISVSEENDLLVQQGLTERAEALDRFWSCPEPRCPRHDPAKGPFVLLPRVRGGRLVCDQHGLDMVDLGPRPRIAQLKIMRDGREVRRFPVAEGTPVTAGRSPGPADLTPFLDDTTRRGVSRTHLRFDLDGPQLTVTDLSRNGTTLIRRDGTMHDLCGGTRPFSVGDRARIHPTLEIIRSGRRYPAELAIERVSAPPDEPPPPTVSF
ncbi:hypothetical protein ACTIVE_0258 [Actinomadura verrucosospora]|uniref:FHA domain-containing protein n=1 Tax=Actinomadura verrucosospora TaxID=46165 RepID=A0A7D3ZU90_ACTVE|nr:hypothetical protein ACTIVE_0258 [Actinomadura verrucosospora]